MSKNLAWIFSFLMVGLVACSDDDPVPSNNEQDTGTDANTNNLPDTGDDTSIPDAGDDADTDVPDMDVVEEDPRVVCPTPVPVTVSGTCDAAPGTAGILIQAAEVLGHDAIYENGYVLVDNSGSIMCAGCDCATVPAAAEATKITCSDAVLSPGLINAHEHITFSTLNPNPSAERYDHRHEWRKGLDGATRIPSPSDNSREALVFVELRNVLTGTTSIAGSGATQGMTRNLDRPNELEGLSGINVDYQTFPLGDNDGDLLEQGCNYPSIDPESVLNGGIYMPHVSEGINLAARNEYLCLSNAALSGVDLIEENTAIVHGVGLNADDIADIASNGAKLIWSPRSNISLYGMTARIPLFRSFGITIGLGTDWSLSGSATMLRELKCADSLNRDQFGGLLSDRELWEMATINGAVALGADGQIGSIRPGRVADLAIYGRVGRSAYRAVIEADTTQTALVLRGGQPLVGDDNIIEALVPAADLSRCEEISICQVDRRVCLERDTGLTLAQVTAAVNQNAYGPFFCGTPANEPTCTPERPGEFDGLAEPGDRDGDGLANSEDSCPDSFNPVRPLDTNMSQADFDNDTTGDECDLCPLAEGDDCPVYDPNDRDSDGVPNQMDNCPGTSNPDQANADGDDAGDACDICPDFDNTNAAYCPATIYDIRNGVYPVGTAIQVKDALVTAASGSQFFVQVDPASTAFNSVNFSGMQVFIGNGGVTGLPNLGDVLTITGSIGTFGGALQIDKLSSVQVDQTGVTVPNPLDVAVADVSTGGMLAEPLQGVLVRVQDVVVTSSNPDAPADFEEWEVSGLRVDDLLYKIPTRPSVGEAFMSITGIMHFSFNNTKLLPRDENDILVGPPALTGIGPSEVFVEAGTTGDSMPALEVKLSGAALGDTTVALTYTGEVTGPATVVIPDGQAGVMVQLTGLAVGTGTVTASLDGDEFTANVTVYDDASVRDVAMLTPAGQDVLIDQMATVRLTLTVPAGTGGVTVNLSTTGGMVAPAMVTVPEGELSVDFAVTAPAAAGTGTVSATLTSTVVASFNVIEPSADCFIISEVIEGSGTNNKAFELFNCSTAPINLQDYSMCLVSNAASSCSATARLATSDVFVAPGAVATYCRAKSGDAVAGIVSGCQTELPTIANFNGDDRLILFRDVDTNATFDAMTDEISDAFGETSLRPGSEIWKDTTYSRCNFTPYDGLGNFLVTDYFTALANGDTSGYGVAPVEGCN